MCQALQVSASGYYDWQTRKPSPRLQRRERIAQAVRRSFIESRAIYGHRKVQEDLVQEEKIEPQAPHYVLYPILKREPYGRKHKL